MRPLPNLHPWSGLEPGIKTRKRMHVDRFTIALSTHAHFLIRKTRFYGYNKIIHEFEVQIFSYKKNKHYDIFEYS